MTLPGPIQRKSEVTPSADPLERQADEVADAVTRGDPAPLQAILRAPSGPGVQRKCDACEDEDKQHPLQRKRAPGASSSTTAGPSGGAAVPQAAAAVVHGSTGRPLDAPTRSFFEPRLGAGLGNVRVHTGAGAARSAAELHAHAYTVGDQIVFGEGRYQPSTSEGQRLLAHELAHVLQQSHLGPSLQREPDSACSAPDRQAKFNTAVERARAMNALAQALLPDKRRRAAQANILGKYGLWGRSQGEKLTMSAVTGQKNAEGYVANYARAQALLGRDPKMICAPADGCRGALVTYDGVFHVCPGWFDLPPEASRGTSRVGSLLQAVYVHMLGQRIKDEDMEADAAQHIPAVSDLMTGVANELGEMGGQGGISFDDALREAATVLAAGFGLSGGRAAGIDPKDGYDARDFSEDTSSRGVLIASKEPWIAMDNMVKNARADVPKAGGGTTRWSFDCFEFVILTRLYAYYRTMPRALFNERFHPLTLGFHADLAGRTGLRWDSPIESTKPGEGPFRYGPEQMTMQSGTMVFDRPKIPEGKTWAQLLRDAPIGTQIIWSNKDAAAKCGKDPTLGFCAFENENVTKVGQDEYSAYPFGIKSEKFIVEAMAAAPFGNDPAKVPKGYIKDNIYISAIRYPKP